jgi:prepilin-type processing-associated H-X9-DG protein
LIELLVVIAVIAMLMAILLPVLGRVRKQARAVVCRMRLRQAESLLSMYAQDHAGRFPDWGLNAWFIVTEPSFELYPKITTCPSAARRPGRDRVPWGGPFAPYAWPVTYADYDHGNWPDHLDIIYGSYGLNLWTYNEYERAKASRRPISEGVHWNVCDLRGASRVPVLLDCSWHIVVPHDNDGPPKSEGHVRDQPMSMICFDRHNGGTNSLFMDWSVRKVGLKEPWTLKWHRKFDTANPWTKAGGVRPQDWPEWMRGFRDY